MRNVTFFLIVVGLMIAGLGLSYYKIKHFGFSLLPGAQTEIWEIEARIRFNATGNNATASFAIPTFTPQYEIVEENFVSGKFGLSFENEDGRRVIWSIPSATGGQSLFYRVVVTALSTNGKPMLDGFSEQVPDELFEPYFSEFDRTAAEAIVADLNDRSADAKTFTALLLAGIRNPPENSNWAALLSNASTTNARAAVASNLLALNGIPARMVRGLILESDQRNAELYFLVQIFDEGSWHTFDPETGDRGAPEGFFVWQMGGISLLDLSGGQDSEVSFSLRSSRLPSNVLARARTGDATDPLLAFSLYALPLEDQTVFKTLLLIPIGALVLVFIRNVIGVATSGTFMPILIALAFQETQVVPGLILFISVVGLGLVIRFWLSQLNLLLVPRISAVVVVVILLMAALSIISHKLGLEQGLTVTFFPMIILAWTIERLSILWEEQGRDEALRLCAGSLFVAVVAHLFMDATTVKHLTFAFPELLLCVLAVILLIGQYSGYRLMELYRFRNLVKS